jgi:ribosomal protein L3 glutamine methyltransferase
MATSQRSIPNPFAKTAELTTPGKWLSFTKKLYVKYKLALGQVSDNAHDEALYLILFTLGIAMDSDTSVLSRKLKTSEIKLLTEVFKKRILEHIPAGYLTKEAWLGEFGFYVDERVIIPRSYFLEIIPYIDLLTGLKQTPKQMVDVCTGSGCLAILLAHAFPDAKVDGIDLSEDALDVAKINVTNHDLKKRITLYQSDVFDSVPLKTYDLILSNPPYEPSAHVDQLPKEFHHEPRMALDGGGDGLDIIRKLLIQSVPRLASHGSVLIEVGGLQEAIDKEFKQLKPIWLSTADGSNCLCMFKAEHLKKIKLTSTDRKARTRKAS